MRLIEIDSSDELAQFIEQVKKDCKPFLAEKPKHMALYRGMKGKPTFVYNKQIRKDRTPSDTIPYIHDLVDEYFYKKFHVKARSQSMFCTGSYSEARGYGFVYSVFPIGNFECIWSPNVEDLYRLIQSALAVNFSEYMADYPFNANSVPKNVLKEMNDKVTEVLDGAHYIMGRLGDAIRSNNEVMIVADSYHAVDESVIRSVDLL